MATPLDAIISTDSLTVYVVDAPNTSIYTENIYFGRPNSYSMKRRRDVSKLSVEKCYFGTPTSSTAFVAQAAFEIRKYTAPNSREL